jgi:hypothetical protein
MLVTYGLIGRLLPRANRIPPITEIMAKATERIGIITGERLTLTAAAAGVTKRLKTRRAPTT